MEDKITHQHVAVFIPTANCRTWLPAAIESIIHQTYPYKDLYVIDDCSGDVDEALMTQYPTVTFISMKERQGPYVIDNLLLQLTDSAYVAFHDADDICHLQRFEHQLHEMELHGWDGCGTWSINIDIYGNPIGFETFPLHVSKHTVLDYQYPVRHPSTIFYRHVFDALVGFDSATRFGADAEFLFRSFLRFRIGNVQRFLYKHAIRPGSLTQSAETGFFSQSRSQYNGTLFQNIYDVIDDVRPAPADGLLLNGNAAGMTTIPDFELLQLGAGNQTWRA